SMTRDVLVAEGWMLTAAGCGPTVEEAQIRDLTAAVNELRAQIARYDQRTEALSNRVILLGDQLDRLQSEPAAAKPALTDPTATLEVVKLQPPAPEPVPEEPPIEIKLTGSEP